MLILTRQPNQSTVLTIGDTEVIVRVLGIDGQQVRLGFEAPDHVHIARDDAKDRNPKVQRTIA